MATPSDTTAHFAELLAGDDDSLVQDVYERLIDVYDWSDEDALPSIDSPFRIAGDVVEANFLISNGGFGDLVTGHLAVLDSISNSFDKIEAKAAAEAIRTVFASLPESVVATPPDARRTLIQIASVPGTAEDNWLGYFANDPQPWALLATYIRKHADRFAELFSKPEPQAVEPDPVLVKRRTLVADYNTSCERIHGKLIAHGETCPRCGTHHRDFRCVIPSDPERQAYFICRECGCTFQRDDISKTQH